MPTGADIIASVRDATDQNYADGDGSVSDAAILRWVNEEYPLVRRMVARIAPDLFASRSTALVVAAGGTEIDVSSLTSLDTIFEVERLGSDSRYRLVLPAGPDPEGSPELVWRQRGMSGAGTVVELYPVSFAPGTYRVRYLAQAAALASGGSVLLPAGSERVLVASAASRVMRKLEREYSGHVRDRGEFLAELAASLAPTNHVIRARVP